MVKSEWNKTRIAANNGSKVENIITIDNLPKLFSKIMNNEQMLIAHAPGIGSSFKFSTNLIHK